MCSRLALSQGSNFTAAWSSFYTSVSCETRAKANRRPYFLGPSSAPQTHRMKASPRRSLRSQHPYPHHPPLLEAPVHPSPPTTSTPYPPRPSPTPTHSHPHPIPHPLPTPTSSHCPLRLPPNLLPLSLTLSPACSLWVLRALPTKPKDHGVEAR